MIRDTLRKVYTYVAPTFIRMSDVTELGTGAYGAVYGVDEDGRVAIAHRDFDESSHDHRYDEETLAKAVAVFEVSEYGDSFTVDGEDFKHASPATKEDGDITLDTLEGTRGSLTTDIETVRDALEAARDYEEVSDGLYIDFGTEAFGATIPVGAPIEIQENGVERVTVFFNGEDDVGSKGDWRANSYDTDLTHGVHANMDTFEVVER